MAQNEFKNGHIIKPERGGFRPYGTREEVVESRGDLWWIRASSRLDCSDVR